MMTGLISQIVKNGTAMAGAGMQYRAAQMKRQREDDALSSAQLFNYLIAQQEAAAEHQAAKERAGAVSSNLMAMPAAQAQAGQLAAQRRASITQRAGAQGQEMGSSPLAAALYRQAQARQGLTNAAADAQAGMGLAGRQERMATLSGNSRIDQAQIPLNQARRNAQTARLQLQQWLQSRIGDEGASKTEDNLNLIGSAIAGLGGN